MAINKLPNVIVVMREGTRALDPELEEMAKAFQFTWLSRIRHVVMPQLAPYLAASSRSGLSIVWKIVLVVELIGRPNGVGFRSRLGLLAVRHGEDTELCDLLHRCYACDRKLSGTTA